MLDLEAKWIVKDKAGRTWTFSGRERAGLVAFLWGKRLDHYSVYQLVDDVQGEIMSTGDTARKKGE